MLPAPQCADRADVPTHPPSVPPSHAMYRMPHMARCTQVVDSPAMLVAQAVDGAWRQQERDLRWRL